MRILMHHRTQGQGVEGVHIRGIMTALRQAGHEVIPLSPPGVTIAGESPCTTAAPLPQKERPVKGKTVWKKIRFFPEFLFEIMELAYNIVSLLRLQKYVRANRFDMIYERYAFLHVAGAMMAHKAKIPFFLEINFTSETLLYRKRSFWIKPLESVIERYVFAKADRLIVVSSALRDLLLGAGIQPDRIIVTPNAVDESVVERPTDGEAVRKRLGLEKRPVIGFVGGFYPWHGIHLLFAALPTILREVPNAAVLLIGDGPLLETFKIEAHQNGLTSSVFFTGAIPHELLPDYIAAFDLAVLPHSNDYGSPMKIYEYMAMGKPVVAPKLSPLEDGMVDQETGLLFPPGETHALATAIVALLQNTKRRLFMGEAARQHVLSYHTWAKNVEAILKPMKKGRAR